MAQRLLPATITVRKVPTTTRPGAAARTLPCHYAKKLGRGKRTREEEEPTPSTECSTKTPKHERLVTTAESGMGEEGPSGNREVLSQHPLEYKKDEEESEGQADLFDSEEERMAQWISTYSCEYCGRMATNPSFPYCSDNCRERDWDKMQQERDSHYDWYCQHNPLGTLLLDYF